MIKELLDALARRSVVETVGIATKLQEGEQCIDGKCYYVEHLQIPKKAGILIHELAYASAEEIDDVYEATFGEITYMRYGDVAVIFSQCSHTIYVIKFI